MIYLGLDLGSTNLKACVFDVAARRLLGSAVLPTPVEDFAIEGPRLMASVAELLGLLGAKCAGGFPAVEGLGISSQMHGLMFAEVDGRPLSPFYTWQSTLAIPHGNDLPGLRPGYTASLWYALKKTGHAPAGSYRVLLLGEYVVSALTGKLCASHVTSAHSTALLRNEEGHWQWDRELLQRLNLPQSSLLELSTQASVAGILMPSYGTIHGLGAVPVHLAVGDQQASLLGGGLGSRSTGAVNIGTGAQVARLLDGKHDQGQWELRPYFGNCSIATVTGLPGGAYLRGEEGGTLDERYTFMARAHAQAYAQLPPSSGAESYVHGTGTLLRRNKVLLATFERTFMKEFCFTPWDMEAPIGAAMAAALAPKA